MKASRRFPPEVAYVRAARRFVLDTAGDVEKQQRDAIAVMVSELAMNAVQYAGTPFDVHVELHGSTLRVEVADSGPGEPKVQPHPPPSSAHGRGLFLVGQLADEWGVTAPRTGPGKAVWFQTSLKAAAPGLAP